VKKEKRALHKKGVKISTTRKLVPYTDITQTHTSAKKKKTEGLCAVAEIRVVRKIFCYLVAKIFYEITKPFRRCRVNIKSGCF
jgi:hypothetical protein